jgi:hypothetical protein
MHGFPNFECRTEYSIAEFLADLENGNIDSIGKRFLRSNGYMRSVDNLVKILGSGKFGKPITIVAYKFSASAKASREKYGRQATERAMKANPEKNMFSVFVNCIKSASCGKNSSYACFTFVAHIRADISLPGLDTSSLNKSILTKAANAGGLFGRLHLFTRRALMKAANFGFSIMTYMSVSIILQLLSAINPSLARIHQERESGK